MWTDATEGVEPCRACALQARVHRALTWPGRATALAGGVGEGCLGIRLRGGLSRIP